MKEFKQTELENGLKIIGEANDTAKSAAIGFFVKAGARDEDDSVSGVSHFLEHMMFKGTARRSALEVTYELGSLGAQANAYTSEENTVYYMGILPEYVPRGLDLLSDMLRPSLDQKEFDVEKKVILEEIALYKDRPSHVLFENALAEHFSSHTAGNSVLGSTESITDLSRQQMLDYYNSKYSPSNMTLAVTGSFDWDKFVSQAGELCSSWENVETKRAYPDYKPVSSEKTLTKAGLNSAQVCLITPGPSAKSEERYAAKVLSVILGDSSGSKTYWEIVDKGLAEAAMIDCDPMDGVGVFYGYASADNANIKKVAELIEGIFQSATNFSEDELERAKTKLASRLVLQGESSLRRLMSMGSGWTYREDFQTLEQEVAKIKAVTKADILACLKEYSFEPRTKVFMLPE